MREKGETSSYEADNVDAEDEDNDEVEVEELWTGLEGNVRIELKPTTQSANVRENMCLWVTVIVHDECDHGNDQRGALGIADVHNECPDWVG